MIIYATEILFDPPTTAEMLIEGVANWLTRKMRQRVDIPFLAQTRAAERFGSQDIETIIDRDGDRTLSWAMRFSHGDGDVPGRRWHTEVGVIAEDGRLRATVLLHTNEASAFVTSPPKPTRPGVVNEILDQSAPAKSTAGLALHTLDEPKLLPLRQRIEHRGRRLPVIIISPDQSGRYSVDCEQLLRQVATLADVYIIPPDLPFADRDRTLGPSYNAWDGAVKIIWPIHPLDRSWEKARTRWFTPEDFDEIAQPGRGREIEVLATIAHRTNLPLSQRHISPERVRENALHRQLARLPHEARESENTYLELLAELERKEKKLLEDMEIVTLEKNDLEEQLRKEQNKTRSIQAQLERATQGRGQVSGDLAQLDGLRSGLTALLDEQVTLTHALQLIGAAFPDRVVILDTAWRSAAEAAQFERSRQALELLWKLATDYWDLRVSANGAADGRQIFGESIAPTDSETVKNNSRARQLRTFSYHGEPIEMWAHLKIGVKDSKAQTWRAHFHWDSERQLIVIGHCGKHLDHE